MQPGWKARPDQYQLDLVGLAEIAERLGVLRATVDQWRHRGVLPDAEWDLQGGPIWVWATIERWADRTGRRFDQCHPRG